ncbi:unnamed protein product [Lactuca virosa]|uniref:Reverse transcriptase Ty1/copia-type domain-containing protein n=1 Tax=Lactuca virosa TaxID=75947 RepID=A0AAU9PJH1_9ASTR|nr:unnamed protein product [Lactuca virosa]
MESEPPKTTGGQSSTDSPINGSIFKGESSSAPKTTEMSFEGENPIPSPTHKDPSEGDHIAPNPPRKSPIEGESPTSTKNDNFDLDTGYTSPVEAEKETTTDEGDQSELEEEVNAELDPAYDPNYPPLVKWTKDHPKAHIIGESSEKFLTRSQLKAKQTALFSKVEFCMFNSFVSKVEPKTVNVALDHSDWVQAMQDELHEFERNRVWRLIPTPKDASEVGLKMGIQE